MGDDSAQAVLDRLFRMIEQRRLADPGSSYTAKLFHRGTHRIAKKVGEEATEVVIAALRGRRERIVEESADLMYHLLVLWADAHVRPHDIWAELARREGVSGIAEREGRNDEDRD